MRHLMLIALVSTAAAAEAPLVTWNADGATLTLARDGSFSLEDGAGPLIPLGRLLIFDPDWHAVGQQGAAVELAEVRDGVAGVRARLAGWTVTQTVRPVAGGWEFDLAAKPAAPIKVNEVSFVADLPIARFSGTRLVFAPGEESRFPEKQPADHHFLSGPARKIVCGTEIGRAACRERV